MNKKTPQFHTNLHYYKSSFQNARKLRKEMTEQERKLWYRFLRDYPVRFYRQRAIDNYIADFYCTEAKLIVEIDGSQHYSDEGEKCDLIRTKYFEALAIKVIRFTNNEVLNNLDSVLEKIKSELNSPFGESDASISPLGAMGFERDASNSPLGVRGFESGLATSPFRGSGGSIVSGDSEIEITSKYFFDKKTLLNVLANYTVFEKEEKKDKKT